MGLVSVGDLGPDLQVVGHVFGLSGVFDPGSEHETRLRLEGTNYSRKFMADQNIASNCGHSKVTS